MFLLRDGLGTLDFSVSRFLLVKVEGREEPVSEEQILEIIHTEQFDFLFRSVYCFLSLLELKYLELKNLSGIRAWKSFLFRSFGTSKRRTRCIFLLRNIFQKLQVRFLSCRTRRYFFLKVDRNVRRFSVFFFYFQALEIFLLEYRDSRNTWQERLFFYSVFFFVSWN